MLKELRESKAELKYIIKMKYFSDEKVIPLKEEASELVAIITATVKRLDEKNKK